MRKLQNQSNFTTEIQSMRGGTNVLFELDFQRHTEEYEREIIIIELRERLDTVTERKSQTELQHKYNSVIEHNLDPIITIDQNFKIIYCESSSSFRIRLSIQRTFRPFNLESYRGR